MRSERDGKSFDDYFLLILFLDASGPQINIPFQAINLLAIFQFMFP